MRIDLNYRRREFDAAEKLFFLIRERRGWRASPEHIREPVNSYVRELKRMMLYWRHECARANEELERLEASVAEG